MARVQTLLEKLRIDAEVRVFWLASGQLDTYERIINGRGSSLDCEIVVGDALRDEEWWNDLEDFRGKSEPMTTSQEFSHMVHILTSTAGRPGVYNPHEEPESQRRRSSLVGVPGMSKRPNIGSLSKMGINIGMHTHHLNQEVFAETDSEWESGSDTETMDMGGSVINPSFPEMSSSNIPQAPPSPLKTGRKDSLGLAAGSGYYTNGNGQDTPSYGTMSTSRGLPQTHSRQESIVTPAFRRIPEVDLDATPRANNRQRSSFKIDIKSIESFPNLDQLAIPGSQQNNSQSSGSTKSENRYSGDDDTSTPRPGLSRQSSAARFSSRPVPEMRITTDETGSRIGFATTNSSSPVTPKTDRPAWSRQSSVGKSSSTQPLSGSRSHRGGGVRAITYTEQPTYCSRSSTQMQSRYRASQPRRESHASPLDQGDVSLNMPELEQSYRSDRDASYVDGAPYSTQSVALSFNDLPSRAQHLILNELMRQNSKNSAVLLTTLPIPVEGTYRDTDRTIQYLSDVELLCHDLPPTLLVLSNNMTVTVSL